MIVQRKSPSGPLSGLRVLEFAGLGPGPFACMMLADHGAEVIRIDRPGAKVDPTDVLARSRRRVELDLKSEEGRAAARELIRKADGLVEGYRHEQVKKRLRETFTYSEGPVTPHD